MRQVTLECAQAVEEDVLCDGMVKALVILMTGETDETGSHIKTSARSSRATKRKQHSMEGAGESSKLVDRPKRCAEHEMHFHFVANSNVRSIGGQRKNHSVHDREVGRGVWRAGEFVPILPGAHRLQVFFFIDTVEIL
ncbi:hypothetical protein RRG08_013535 [Elysia crispata]|uniref:Uncharacterized protein n=1 Tax=Elysia crispata TaxID=231223 RepID=A0AAE1CQR2_9GAST|nr:hypothetical protein RRG08_013535 [Elysia crispata]